MAKQQPPVKKFRHWSDPCEKDLESKHPVVRFMRHTSRVLYVLAGLMILYGMWITWDRGLIRIPDGKTSTATRISGAKQ